MNLIRTFFNLPWTFAFFFLLFSLLLRCFAAMFSGKHRRTAVLLAGSVFDILAFPLVAFHVLYPYLLVLFTILHFLLTLDFGALLTMDFSSLLTAFGAVQFEGESIWAYWPIVFDLIVLVYYVMLTVMETKEAVKSILGTVRANKVSYSFCPHCGAEQFNNLNSQCTNCGKAISTSNAEEEEEEDLDKLPTWKRVELARKKAAASENPQTTSCRFCGASIQEQDMFCIQCGKRQR